MALSISGSGGGGVNIMIDGREYDEDISLRKKQIKIAFPSATYGNVFRYGAAVVTNHRIYLLGGTQNGTDPGTVYEWDGVDFSVLSPMPYQFITSPAVVYNGEVHVLGGASGNTEFYHYKRDMSSWRDWSSVSTIPISGYGGSAVVYNGEIHLFNGTNHYKWDGTSWTSVSTLPITLTAGTNTAVVYNGEIHLLSRTNHYKWDGTSWTSVSVPPYNVLRGCAVVFDDAIHIMGLSGDSNVNNHYVFNGETWDLVDTLYSSTYDVYPGDAQTVVWNNKIHYIGGIRASGTSSVTNSALLSWEENLTTKSRYWTDKATLYLKDDGIYTT